jgi:hypothetical protein
MQIVDVSSMNNSVHSCPYERRCRSQRCPQGNSARFAAVQNKIALPIQTLESIFGMSPNVR